MDKVLQHCRHCCDPKASGQRQKCGLLPSDKECLTHGLGNHIDQGSMGSAVFLWYSIQGLFCGNFGNWVHLWNLGTPLNPVLPIIIPFSKLDVAGLVIDSGYSASPM